MADREFSVGDRVKLYANAPLAELASEAVDEIRRLRAERDAAYRALAYVVRHGGDEGGCICRRCLADTEHEPAVAAALAFTGGATHG